MSAEHANITRESSLGRRPSHRAAAWGQPAVTASGLAPRIAASPAVLDVVRVPKPR